MNVVLTAIQKSQNIVLYSFCCVTPRLACDDNYVYKILETGKSQVMPYVPTGTAFCKPGHKYVPNVPFWDTGTTRSKPGLSRSAVRLVSLN